MIDILLATYNGEKYLIQQLDSILDQSFNQWRVLVRDDGSSDRSCAILKEYQKKFPNQFHIISCELGNVGILQNFLLLMQYSEAPYVMLCDQDDIWKPNKISLTLQAMKEAESISFNKLPILVHTDLQVVDERLNVLNKSFWHYQHINPYLDSYNRLLVQNTVTGCTVMINRALLNLAIPIPSQVIMHDWWLALVASSFGKIVVLEEQTMLYRQHGNNDTGAKEWSLVYVVKKALTLFNRTELLRSIRLTQLQAEVFYNRFSQQLTNNQKGVIVGYIGLEKKNRVFRALFLFRNRLLKQGVIRNIALFIRI
ncbi:MAG: glycosyltransferase family 2 protein [Methyloprofundus sp.]|nr:glycosyltransferase family 2 protein [Methyloprofundus sp.]MBW6453480.1 glycosyltransferase family 2 protein [Methyloprofundus sp.]